MTTENTYNGWTNYETWVVNLWLDNDEGSQEYIQEQALECVNDAIESEESDVRNSATYELSKRLESMHDESMPEVTGVFADLMTHALGMVNWYEIAEHAINEIEIFSAGWNMPGFMPDNEPSLFTDADDALEYATDEMRNTAGEIMTDNTKPLEETDRLEAELIVEAADTAKANSNGEFGQTVGKYHYFVTKV